MKEIITIEKVSATEIKRIKVTPEVVIPEKIEETIISLEEIEKELEEVNNQIARAENSKEFDMKQYRDAEAKHDSILAPLQEKRLALEVEIQNAKDMGVKVDVKPMEEVLPAEVVMVK